MTQLSIKNMVCPRCVTAVMGVLQSLGYDVTQVNIGNATVTDDLTAQQLDTLDAHLRKIGLWSASRRPSSFSRGATTASP